MKKYELTSNFKMFLGRKLFQIKALISFGSVVKGELGGYIEKEENLSHENSAWVYGDARVCGNAEVYGDAHYLLVGRIGSRFAFTTFFRNKYKGISVRCGCFFGTITEFRAKVKETHGVDSKFAKVYQATADLAELQIDLSDNKNED